MSKRKHEGVLLVDHRASPGITPEEAHRANTLAVPEGKLFESPTITCSHCNTIVVLNPDRSRPRGYCRSCDHYICDDPKCNHECSPMNKKLDLTQEQLFRKEQGYSPLYVPEHLNLLKENIING